MHSWQLDPFDFMNSVLSSVRAARCEGDVAAVQSFRRSFERIWDIIIPSVVFEVRLTIFDKIWDEDVR
jgi:hypothetical protein